MKLYRNGKRAKITREFLKTHTHLSQCPNHPLPARSDDLYQYYPNEDIIEAGGFIGCEICGTPMYPTASPLEIARENARLTDIHILALVEEAHSDLRVLEGDRSLSYEVKIARRIYIQHVITALAERLSFHTIKISGNGSGGTRCYRTVRDCKIAHTHLKRCGWNHFLLYKEVYYGDAFPFGLQYCMSEQPVK